MNRQIWGQTPLRKLNPDKPLYVCGKRNANQAKSRFLISHPVQAKGAEHRTHIAGTAGMSFLEEVLPFAKKDRLIFSNEGSTDPPVIRTPRVHILGLGDVGMHCALGLYLLGQNDLSLGLYARDPDTAEGLCMELRQCLPPDPQATLPNVTAVGEEALYNCDALVFSASAGVPKTLQPGDDVRMMQFAKNKQILSVYLEGIRKNGFSGTLFILSDPVDALCAYAAEKLSGVLPRERIIGLGLGVMAARASYYAADTAPEYLSEGRAYGPHGEGLWIANSLDRYDDERSLSLTRLAKTANLAIRAKGLKPFYGPSLSSGAYSLLAWVRGEWFYASISVSDVYFGCRVRQHDGYLYTEHRMVAPALAVRLDDTFAALRSLR